MHVCARAAQQPSSNQQPASAANKPLLFPVHHFVWLPLGRLLIVYIRGDARWCSTFFRDASAVSAKTGRDYPDVVTEADLAAEREMRLMITTQQPTHGILGEELGSVQLEADWVWVLDPVDGTRDFATGTLSWGTLIGLCWRGRPVLGVIDQPVTRERWVGVHGHPTLYVRNHSSTYSCTWSACCMLHPNNHTEAARNHVRTSCGMLL